LGGDCHFEDLKTTKKKKRERKRKREKKKGSPKKGRNTPKGTSRMKRKFAGEALARRLQTVKKKKKRKDAEGGQ